MRVMSKPSILTLTIRDCLFFFFFALRRLHKKFFIYFYLFIFLIFILFDSLIMATRLSDLFVNVSSKHHRSTIDF